MLHLETLNATAKYRVQRARIGIFIFLLSKSGCGKSDHEDKNGLAIPGGCVIWRPPERQEKPLGGKRQDYSLTLLSLFLFFSSFLDLKDTNLDQYTSELEEGR
jgi:hypothetical protein